MSNLTFKRKLSKSRDNRAAVIALPRAIVQSWRQYNSVDIAFDGRCLVITPSDESRPLHGEEKA
jgi:hypothetical protein